MGSAPGLPLLQLPIVMVTGTFQQRLEQLGAVPGGTGDLDALVDEAVSGYLLWGADNPVMLVHAATAPAQRRWCCRPCPRRCGQRPGPWPGR